MFWFVKHFLNVSMLILISFLYSSLAHYKKVLSFVMINDEYVSQVFKEGLVWFVAVVPYFVKYNTIKEVRVML